jgi:hypothetical protein
MPKQPSTSIFGWASIVCSLIPWTAVGLSFIPRLSRLDLNFTQITFFLGAGMLLAFIAAARGTGRWAFVALLDLATFFVFIFVLNLGEAR